MTLEQLWIIVFDRCCVSPRKNTQKTFAQNQGNSEKFYLLRFFNSFYFYNVIEKVFKLFFTLTLFLYFKNVYLMLQIFRENLSHFFPMFPFYTP